MALVTGYSDLMVRSRCALLDALEALAAHREALVLVGAHAVYLYTGDADVNIATSTSDSDIALVPDLLSPAPIIGDAMHDAGFHQDFTGRQGLWLTADDVEVELLVPDGLQVGRSRGARIPPHDNRTARRVAGLEAAVVDHRRMTVSSLDPAEGRRVEVKVAGPAALVVSKVYKISDRLAEVEQGRKDRLVDKDAHDVYRLLAAVEAGRAVAGFKLLLASEVCCSQAHTALEALAALAATPSAPLCVMAGRAEGLAGDPEAVAASTWGLVQELLDGLEGVG